MSAPITIQCPACNARIKAPGELLGQSRKCPRCKKKLEIKLSPPEDRAPLMIFDEELVTKQ